MPRATLLPVEISPPGVATALPGGATLQPGRTARPLRIAAQLPGATPPPEATPLPRGAPLPGSAPPLRITQLLGAILLPGELPMPGGTKPPPGRATPLSRGAAPPSEETLPNGATPPPGALPHRHLARPLRGSGQRNEIQSLKGIPPQREAAPREEAQRLRETDPSKEIRIWKGTPLCKMKLLMKSMLVLLPALMRAADPQLKGSHLPPRRSALSALGVTVQRNRGSPGSPVYTTDEWPLPSHTAKEGRPKELSPRRDLPEAPAAKQAKRERGRGQSHFVTATH